MQDVQIRPEGDSAILMVFEQEIRPDINRRITAIVQMIKQQQIEGIVDLIPAFSSLLVSYDPRIISYRALHDRLQALASVDLKASAGRRRVIEIPVLYGGKFGPDISTVAKHAGLSEEEVIRIHTQPDYLIYMLGFLPGFTYLGGLDERIHTPRLSEPRLMIPAGSVGIAAGQTGIYPLNSPGGWQLIGITPVKTYDPGRPVPIMVSAGEYIRFTSISEERFEEISRLVAAGAYECPVHELDDEGNEIRLTATHVYKEEDESDQTRSGKTPYKTGTYFGRSVKADKPSDRMAETGAYAEKSTDAGVKGGA